MFPNKEAKVRERNFPCVSELEVGCDEVNWAIPILILPQSTHWVERDARLSWVSGAGWAKPAQSQGPILLVLGPLDALEVNAILYHLPERTHFSKTLHMVNAFLCSVVYFLLCSETANAKPDRRVC